MMSLEVVVDISCGTVANVGLREDVRIVVEGARQQ